LKIKADGNNSLVVKLDCLGRRFLFTGDNSATAEKALLKSGWELKASVLKASHHGSDSANSEGFLRAVNPSLLAISVGSDNKFGHPHPKVLDRAESLGISVRRTDQEGDLLISIPAKIAN
jgi:beta-lactamase superfamily II metal-dependent hydrolase